MNTEKSGAQKSGTQTNMENFTALDHPQQPWVPSHRRSASDSIASEGNKPYLTNSILSLRNSFDNAVGDLETYAIKNTDARPSLATSSNSCPGNGQVLDFNNHCSTMDPKKIKRLLANRESAQRSRLKKQEYIEKLKKEIAAEEFKVLMISPQVAYYQLQRIILENENAEIKKRLEILEKQRAYKEAEFQALQKEREALTLAYMLAKEEKLKQTV